MALEDFLRIARIGLYEHYRHNDFEYSRKNWGRAHRIFAGQGDIEGQIRWRWWRKETDSRPEVFSFAEVVLPHHKDRPLTGTPGLELKLGAGVIRGFGWGTLTARADVE